MELIKSIFSRSVVGLDIGVSGVKAVELSVGKKVSLLAYNRILLPADTISPEGVIKNDKVLVQALKKLFSGKGFSTRKVSVGIFGNSILSKPILMPQMDKKDVEDQIYWEAEQHIPFNIDECSLDFAVLGNTVQKIESGTKSMMEVLLVAAKKDYIQNITGVVEMAGLQPSVVDYQTLALGNAFEFNYRTPDSPVEAGESDVVIDFGAGSTKLSIIDRENTVFIRKLAPCGRGYTELISERTGDTFENSEAMKLSEPDSPLLSPIIKDYNAHLISEVQKSIDLYFTQSSERSLRKIFYCGGTAQTPGLIEMLNEKYPEQVESFNPLRMMHVPVTSSNIRMLEDLSCLGAVAVGLALRQPGDSR